MLLSRERVPAMLALLLFGAVVAVARQPALFDEFSQVAFRFQLPHFALARLGWEDILTGVFVLPRPSSPSATPSSQQSRRTVRLMRPLLCHLSYAAEAGTSRNCRAEY